MAGYSASMERCAASPANPPTPRSSRSALLRTGRRCRGKGHAVAESKGPWGRPVAQWIPSWGEEGKRELSRLYDGLVSRFGKGRADRIATFNRNLFIFPNLVINDIMAVTVRTYYPAAPDFMNISAWALAPKEETEWARKYRLFNFL